MGGRANGTHTGESEKLTERAHRLRSGKKRSCQASAATQTRGMNREIGKAAKSEFCVIHGTLKKRSRERLKKTNRVGNMISAIREYPRKEGSLRYGKIVGS